MAESLSYKVRQEIRNRRLRLGYTQKDLASKIGTKYQVILQYEKGTRRISIKKLYELAEALSTTARDLACGQEVSKEMERIAQNYAKEALTIYQRILNEGGQIISGSHISSKVITIDGKDFTILDPGNKINKKNIKGIESIDRDNGVKDWVIKNGEEKFIVATTKNGWVTIDPKGEIQDISRLHPIRTGQDPISYSRQVKVQIKKGEVPNTAISVAVTENLAVVTLSGTDSLGLVIFIDRKQGVTYTKPLTRNKEIAGEKVTVDQSIENVINALRESGEDFPPWLPSNCAEPSALVALSSSKEAFPQSLNSRSYKTDDIDFLATYKVPKPFPGNIDFKKPLDPKFSDLVPFERCNHCKVTTGSVRNVITDPGWLKKISELETKLPNLNEKFDLYKGRLYFLIPYHDMTNRLARVNIMYDRENSASTNSTRVRRSVFTEQTKVKIISNYKNNISNEAYDVDQQNSRSTIDTSKKITSSATKTSSFINNVFSWAEKGFSRIKSSIGGLLTESTASSVSKVDMQFASVSNVSSNGSLDAEEITKHKLEYKKDIPNSTRSNNTGQKQESKHDFANGDFFQDNVDYINANLKQMRERQTPVKFKPSGGNTILEMGDYYLSQADFNGTITLLDILIRKLKTGEKHVSTQVKDISGQEALNYGLKITQECEKIVEEAALRSGISMHHCH